MCLTFISHLTAIAIVWVIFFGIFPPDFANKNVSLLTTGFWAQFLPVKLNKNDESEIDEIIKQAPGRLKSKRIKIINLSGLFRTTKSVTPTDDRIHFNISITAVTLDRRWINFYHVQNSKW